MIKLMLSLAATFALVGGSMPSSSMDDSMDEVTPMDCLGCDPCPTHPEKIGYGFGGEQSEWIVLYACPQGLLGSCDDLAECGEEQEQDAEELQLAALAGNASQIVGILKRTGVLLVAERSAVQVMDCDGDHVAYHIPLQPQLLQTVVDLQQ